jgi:hypothetical protein
LKKHPRKHRPSHLLSPREAFKKSVLWFVFLRLNKTGFMFTAALQAGPLKTKGARKKIFLFCLVNFLKTPNKTPSASAAMAEGGVKKTFFVVLFSNV